MTLTLNGEAIEMLPGETTEEAILRGSGEGVKEAPESFTKRMCKLHIKNGVFFLKMPDGTNIPEQLDCKIEVDQVFSMTEPRRRPMFAKVTISVCAELIDTI